MLEKVGLPAKPALRGNEWVLDASHCQACNSAFSFFNWKHHCRRCGGIFCANCTQQKMTLRGQGEEPVRICNSCKKAEDVARFDARHGRRNRALKGSSKSSSQMEDDLILKDLIPSVSTPQSSGRTSLINDNHDLANTLELNACTSVIDEKAHSMGRLLGTQEEVNEEGQNSVVTPEILRQQAMQEKRQWMVLKRERKNEEALLAFKRGRELERQAENLELSLRRSQRKLTNSALSRKEKHEDHIGSERKKMTRNLPSVEEDHCSADSGLKPIKSKRELKEAEEKDDLWSALKDLGWTDADPDVGVKQSKARTVENELAEIAAAVHQVEDSGPKRTISSEQVLSHKRRALALKREGKLTEAKEELKKAKIIERQLEEQEMGNAEESDDDLAALIRGMERESTTRTANSSTVDMASFSVMAEFEKEDDQGIEVTDSDMNDPEMAAALRSIGWEEETAAIGKYHANSVKGALLTSKQQGWNSLGLVGAINLKDPALEFMANASLNDNEDGIHVTDEDMEDPHFQSALKAMGFAEEEAEVAKPVISATTKSLEKRNLQQQILTMKKEALGLKRTGKIQEAKEKLAQAKKLENELELVQTQHLEENFVSAASFGPETIIKNTVGPSEYGTRVSTQETSYNNVDVTEEDMGDPEFTSTLKSFGWQDDWATEGTILTEKKTKAVISKPSDSLSRVASATNPPKKRSELQKELLGLKRAALKLRREGQLEEAEEELKKAHVLEQLIQESESELVPPKLESHIQNGKRDEVAQYQEGDVQEKEEPTTSAALRSFGSHELERNVETMWKETFITTPMSLASEKDVETMPKTALDNTWSPVHTSTLTEGTSREIDSGQKAEKMSTDYSNNEFNSENKNGEVITSSNDTRIGSFDSDHDRQPSAHVQTPPEESAKADAAYPMAVGQSFAGEADVVPSMNLRDTEESRANVVAGNPLLQDSLQREILAYKKKALALKREGKQAEAKEQLRQAKMLEKQLALQSSQQDVEGEASHMLETSGNARIVSEVDSKTTSTVASAMEGSSHQAARASNTGTGSHDSQTASFGSYQSPAQKYTAGKDRLKLQQESLAHKRKALALRREGRMDEAEAEFDLAKCIEKQMEDLGGSDGGTVSMSTGLHVSPAFGHEEKDDTSLVDDLFDPQLLAALKGLGWKESDLIGQTPNARQDVREKSPMQTSGKTDLAPGRQNEERRQLEERIKSQKIHAVQLKRSGLQSEALNVLRGAKQLERQLQSMSQ